MLNCIFFTWYRFDENSQSMEQGFPRIIADDFSGVELKIDAVYRHLVRGHSLHCQWGHFGTFYGIKMKRRHKPIFKLFKLITF